MFALILGEPCGGLERLPGVRCSPEPGQQIAAYGVEQVVAVERQAVDDAQRRGRAVDLGHRDRTVEGRDRARVEPGQLVVERDYLLTRRDALISPE